MKSKFSTKWKSSSQPRKQRKSHFNLPSHLIAREMLIRRNYPGIGEVPLPGVPIKLSKTPGRVETNAAGLGEHNAEIFGQLLQYSQKELDSLKLQGVI